MRRPDASTERMVSVTKRYGLLAVLVLSALLATLLVRPEILVGPVFLLAVLLSARLGGMGRGWSLVCSQRSPSLISSCLRSTPYGSIVSRCMAVVLSSLATSA
jgi:hypothetical protein